MSVELLPGIKRDLNEQIANVERDLCEGNCRDWAEYKGLVNRRKGLKVALDIVKDHARGDSVANDIDD